ncbi:MAG: DMT family transporter [Hyphomicrobiaceae bacterium]|nr:DMT family transporter [Hyphomicrobiaceae bacterium]
MVSGGKPGADGSPAGDVAAAGLGQSNNTAGIIAMLVAMASFACGDSLMKLSAVAMPTGELVWLRALAMASASFLYALVTGAFRNAWRLVAPPMLLRAVGDVGGAICFQSALARMAFADLIAIIQVNPLLVTAASAVFLAERVGWRRWTAAAVGLVGVLLIIRPGTSAFTWWSMIAIISVLFATLRDVSTKSIDRAVPAVLIIWLSSTLVGIGGLSLAIFEDWVWPEPGVVLQVMGAGAFSLIGHICIITAVRTGELSAVAPFRYSIVVWALILGLLIWGDLPDLLTLLGMVIVTAAGLYSFHRELVARRKT